MSTDTQPIDLLIDFSALRTLGCQRKYQLTCLQGLDTSSQDTAWGSAFHKYAEARQRGCNDPAHELVFACAKGFNLDDRELTRLLTTAQTWEAKVKPVEPARDTDRNPLVEWKFSFPYMTVNQYRIVLCGTVDLIYMANDWLLFRDYKTTAKASGLDQQLAEYMSSFQIPFYLYCIQHHLAHLLEPEAADLAAAGRINGYYQMVYKSFTPAKISDSSPVLAWPREEIEAVLHPLIAQAVQIADYQTLAPASGTATGVCKNCSFFHVCLTKIPERRENLLAAFPRRVYNPMEFR